MAKKGEIFEEKKREEGGVRSNLAWKHLKHKDLTTRRATLRGVPSPQITFFANAKCQKGQVTY